MRQRALGKTGLLVSELGLGTWGLLGAGYGHVDLTVAHDVVNRAMELGVTLFDVSDAYGAGTAEVHLGDWLPAEVTLVTRLGVDLSTYPPTRKYTPEFLRARVEASLLRQRRSYLDVCMLHHPSEEDLRAGALDVLALLRTEGKLAHTGVACATAEVGRAALCAGANVITVPYNLSYLDVFEGISGDVQLERAGLIARSVLAYGLLSGTWTRGRSFEDGDHRAERWQRHELDERLTQLDALRFLVRAQITSLRDAAVRFPLSQEVVSAALLGPRSVGQLDELVRGAGTGPTYIPDAAVRELWRSLARHGLSP